MATVKERKAGNRTYYYLVHTIRNGKESLKKEKYLGKKLPENIDELKEPEKAKKLFDSLMKDLNDEN